MEGKSGTELVEPVVVCQVCYDAVPLRESVSQICQESCHGIMCAECVSSFMKVCSVAAPLAVVSRLKCPICALPLNLQRLIGATSTFSNAWIIRSYAAAFRGRMEGLCDVLCPTCANPANILSDAREADDAIDNDSNRATWPNEILTTFPGFPDEIIATTVRYCNYRMTANELLAYLERVVGSDKYLEYAQHLWWHMYDPERRVSLFLAAMKKNPFELTPCCQADVCFECQSAGRHDGEPCTAFLPAIDDIAQCPHCDIMLVKGDGCNLITCICGQAFHWDDQVAKYHLKTRTIEVLKAHRRAFKTVLSFMRRRVCQRMQNCQSSAESRLSSERA